MVVGMISVAGVGPYSATTVKLTQLYTKIFKHLISNLRSAINQPAVFMEDNAPCRTVKSEDISFWGGCWL